MIMRSAGIQCTRLIGWHRALVRREWAAFCNQIQDGASRLSSVQWCTGGTTRATAVGLKLSSIDLANCTTQPSLLPQSAAPPIVRSWDCRP